MTTSMSPPQSNRPLDELRQDLGGLLTRGAVAGLVAGGAFMLANMWFADANGKPAVAPFLSVATVFHASAAPSLSPTAVPAEVVTGLWLHVVLSAAFGMGFGALVPFARRNLVTLSAAAILWGLALFVLNFEILGRTVFPWFTNPHGPNDVFEGFIHPLIFGALLIPFFVGRVRPKAAP